jgi:hypothetical protein
MGKDVFFFHHTHAEGGAEEDSMSKYNLFEVIFLICLYPHSDAVLKIAMIKALVHHLLRYLN